MQDFEFDKFIDDIKQYANDHADSPARRYNERYREKTHNRIRYGAEEEK